MANKKGVRLEGRGKRPSRTPVTARPGTGRAYTEEGPPGAARGSGPGILAGRGLLSGLHAREGGVDDPVLLGLVGPALTLHDRHDEPDEEHGHHYRGHERGDIVHAPRVASPPRAAA